MKILQIHNYYKTRGGECSVVQAEAQLLSEYDHTVIQFTRDSRDIDSMSFVNKINSFLRIPYNKTIYKELTEFLQQNKPEVAHVHNVFPLMSPSVYDALKDSGIPVVQTLHNYRFLCPNGQFFVNDKICEDCQTSGFYTAVKKRCVRNSSVISALYARAIERFWKTGKILKNISQFIALNKFVANKMIESGVPENKIAICGNYIATEEETEVLSKRPYIFYLGRLSAEKGVATLLKAVSLLDDVLLKVAGSGPEEKKLRKLALEQNGLSVEFVGHVSGQDKKRLIAEAMCTVVPSEWYENFPISVLESLVLGTPVIASRVGGLPDMIEHGVTGLLFEPGDSKGLAECIRVLQSNSVKLNNMSQQAMSVAVSQFGPEKHYRQLIEIYKKAVNKYDVK